MLDRGYANFSGRRLGEVHAGLRTRTAASGLQALGEGDDREGVRAQTEQALTNLAAILQAAGTSMEAVVKTTIFYTNVDDFATINEIYATRMPDPPPARSAPANIELPRGLLVSIEAIAVVPDTV